MNRFDVTVWSSTTSFHVVIVADNKHDAIEAAKLTVDLTSDDWKFLICDDSCPDC